VQAEQSPVERHAEQPGHDADEQHQGKGLEGRRRIAAHRERGELSGEPSGDHHGADDGHQRAAIGRHRQRPPQLLQGEDEASERRIEHRGQPRARSAGHELLLRGPLPPAGGLPHRLGGASAHLDRGALEAKREAGADAEGAADELHGQERLPRHVAQSAQHRLDVRNAAARRIGREADGQPPGRAPDREAEEGERHPPPARMRVGSREKDEPHVVDAVDGPAEEHGQPSCQDSDGRGARDLSRRSMSRGRAVRTRVARFERVHNE
jgi:hypothetical protein